MRPASCTGSPQRVDHVTANGMDKLREISDEQRQGLLTAMRAMKAEGKTTREIGAHVGMSHVGGHQGAGEGGGS